MRLRERLEGHEGKKNYPYKDSEDIWTIGIGHNMEVDPLMKDRIQWYAENGMSDEEVYALLDKDIAYHEAETFKLWPWVARLTRARQEAMIELNFILEHKLLRFVHFLAAMERSDWQTAKIELVGTDDKPSLFKKEVKHRADDIAAQIIAG